MAYTFTEDDERKYSRRGAILIPPITDSTLVFPLDQETKKFDKSFYSPALTDGRFSSEQVNNVLNEIEETHKKKLKVLRALRIYLGTAFVVGFFILMLFTTTVLSNLGDYSDYEDSDTKQQGNLRHGSNYDYYELEAEEELFLLWGGWMFFFFGALFWSIVLAIYSKYSLNKARKGVQAAVDRNNQFFPNHGLRWNLPKNFPHYIELWKDYRGLNFNQTPLQPPQIYLTVPPSNQVPTPIKKQNHEQEQTQLYSNFNQIVDQNGYISFQPNLISKPFLNNHLNALNGQENGNYTPPFTMMFNNN